LMIDDEVFTGFGRTGKDFRCDLTGPISQVFQRLTGGTMAPKKPFHASTMRYDGFIRPMAENAVPWPFV